MFSQICAALATSQSILTVNVTGFAIKGDGQAHLWSICGAWGNVWPILNVHNTTVGLQIRENQKGGENQLHANICFLCPVGRVVFLSAMLSSLCWTNPSETVSLNKPFPFQMISVRHFVIATPQWRYNGVKFTVFVSHKKKACFFTLHLSFFPCPFSPSNPPNLIVTSPWFPYSRWGTYLN